MSPGLEGPLDRKAAAHVLEQIADFLELKGENPFRVRGFRVAARAVSSLAVDLRTALASGALARARGVGPATLRIVSELADTGRASMLEDLREQIPPGLVEMLRVPGLSITKIRQIHDLLDIDSLPDLEDAARDGRLARLPRFGPKTAENVLRGIAFVRQAAGLRLYHHAADEAETLCAALARLPGVLEAHIAGEVRRRTDIVRQVVLVLVAGIPSSELFRRLSELPGVDEFAGQDERTVTLRFTGGTSAQVIVTPPANAGAVLVQATGSEDHLRELAARAERTGFSLRGGALWRGSEFVPAPDERRFYAALGLAWIPPELREGRGEVGLAERGQLPALVERRDLAGLLHCHTKYSDGSNTVEEIAVAAREAGYAWIGITDHSAAAAYAGGLQAEDLHRQADEIEAVNERLEGIRILKGVEADILQDGSVDYDEATLARLDFVIGSVHSRFGMDREAMTARMLTAMDNPRLTIVGHPTGRLLLAREAYAVDIEALIGKAAETGVALEINADPHRLDLSWRLAAEARAAGVRLSIGVDAHSAAGLAHAEFGIGVARKAGLEAGDLLNSLSADDFTAFARRRL